MSSLKTYRAKRDSSRTPEPFPSRRRPSPKAVDAASFVIHEHHASHLHWDLRLERDGVLVSWAVPKGMPMDPKQNHLAVHVEDHPLEYAAFHGTIPAGEYGAGTVTIWDAGTYECEKWTDAEVKVVLHGKHLEGRYVLFQTDGDQWMAHRMDPPPSGWEPLPAKVNPMLATAGHLPEGEGWSYEFKWDGVRAIAYIDGGRVRLMSRNGRDISTSYPELARLGLEFGSKAAILDGEIIALDERGTPSFASLQPRMHVSDAARAKRLSASAPAHYFIFDLLHLGGRDLLAEPYSTRRELLEGLELEGGSWRTPPRFESDGVAVLSASEQRGLEGVLAKRTDSPYRPGKRTPDWVKVKHAFTQEVVVGGWTPGKGSRAGSIGALLVGIPNRDGTLDYAGKVGSGFGATQLRSSLSQLAVLECDESPFGPGVPKADAAVATWVRPELVGEVALTEWTKDGRLRHPSWRGWRTDKRAQDVQREEVVR